MAHFLDDLVSGQVSRRAFLGRLSAAGAAATLVGSAFPLEVAEAFGSASGGAAEEQPPELIYSPANIGGGGRIERNFYRNWIRTSGVPIVEGYSIYDARNHEAQPWPEIEGRGFYLNFSGNVHMDGMVLEIPAGGALAPRRQFYEQLICVLAGSGRTVFGQGSSRREREWGEGSLFAVPLNVPHRHHNQSAERPARLLAVTTFPFMLQVFGSIGMIENLDYDFTDRYDGSSDYFTESEKIHTRWWRTNFVPDMRSAEVVAWEERGKGNASAFWKMGGNTILEPHISEFPVNTYKLGHRHPYEAIILTLNGEGYSLAGLKGLREDDEPVRLPWKAGSVVSPPYYWYHQHFNTGDTRARYWAITEGDFPKRLGIPLEVEQIEVDQEDPSIRRRFEKEVGRTRVGEAHPNPGVHLESAPGVPERRR